VVKLSPSGNIQWQKSLGGSSDDLAYGIIQTTDSGYMVTGYSNSNDSDVSGNHGNEDYWIVKLTSSGNIQWQKSLGGSGYDEASGICQANDGGYVIVGSSNSNDGDVSGNYISGDAWVVKVSSIGNIQWQQCFGGNGKGVAYSVATTTDGGSIVSGFIASDSNWIFKLSSSGGMDWQTHIGESRYASLLFRNCVRQTADGNYIFCGSVFTGEYIYVEGSPQEQINVYVVKLGPDVGVTNVVLSHAISIHPNPTTGMVYVKGINTASIQVHDLLGRKVQEEKIKDNFSISGLPNGMYILKIFDEQQQMIYQGKLVKD
jgi:hypothetical protein